MDKQLLFIDIETVAETNDYETYPKKKIWAERYCKEIETTEEKAYHERSPLVAEFGKIVCISCGSKWNNWEIRVTSFRWDDEKKIIQEFFALLDKIPAHELAGHNIKSFDIPFIFRRALINWIRPHAKVNFGNLPPWKILVTDIMEYRKNGGFISTGLELMTACLGIKSPKEKMNWSEVSAIYRNISDPKLHERVLQDIKEYCEEDVKASIRVWDKIVDPTIDLNIEQKDLFSGAEDTKEKESEKTDTDPIVSVGVDVQTSIDTPTPDDVDKQLLTEELFLSVRDEIKFDKYSTAEELITYLLLKYKISSDMVEYVTKYRVAVKELPL